MVALDSGISTGSRGLKLFGSTREGARDCSDFTVSTTETFRQKKEWNKAFISEPFSEKKHRKNFNRAIQFCVIEMVSDKMLRNSFDAVKNEWNCRVKAF